MLRLALSVARRNIAVGAKPVGLVRDVNVLDRTASMYQVQRRSTGHKLSYRESLTAHRAADAGRHFSMRQLQQAFRIGSGRLQLHRLPHSLLSAKGSARIGRCQSPPM